MKKWGLTFLAIALVVCLLLAIVYALYMQEKGCEEARQLFQAGEKPTEQQQKIVDRARMEVKSHVLYDPSYKPISFPGGDIDPSRGTCADVVVRALRADNIDLQKNVYLDRRKNPRFYGREEINRSIDHRRCRNQIIWMRRHALEVSDWQPGDIVYWNLTKFGRLLHAGVISDATTPEGRPLVIHNLGPNATEDDSLVRWKIIGHFRILTK